MPSITYESGDGAATVAMEAFEVVAGAAALVEGACEVGEGEPVFWVRVFNAGEEDDWVVAMLRFDVRLESCSSCFKVRAEVLVETKRREMALDRELCSEAMGRKEVEAMGEIREVEDEDSTARKPRLTVPMLYELISLSL